MVKRSSYSKLTIEDIQKFGIRIIYQKHFEASTLEIVEPSDWIELTLKKNLKQPTTTEKAKSEYIIAPILTEMNEQNPEFTCFSGFNFEVDKSLGLNGRCDFLLSLYPDLFSIEAPIFAIVEAKNGEIEAGIPQCVAQQYAAQIFNKRHKKEFPFIYGAVTTGFDWRFVRLENDVAYVDTDVYYLNDLPRLLSVLQKIIDLYKKK
jgi:hypothetical protein